MNRCKPKKLLGLLPILLLLLQTGCTIGDELSETATLTLSEVGIVSLDPGKVTREVGVTTDAPDWSCYTANSWISATKKDDHTLLLSAEANPTSSARMGSVVVTASGVRRQLTIMQGKGTEVIIAHAGSSAGSSELKITQWGETRSIDVESGTDLWTAKSDDEWITVTPYPVAKRIDVRVAPNRNREPREGKIMITLQGESSGGAEIRVTQSGVDWFILPYMNFETATRPDIQLFEKERGGAIEDESERFFTFSTTSSAFPRVVYTIYAGGAYLYAQVDASSTQLLLGEARLELISFLKESGFTEQVDENTYRHKDQRNLTVEIKPFFKNTPHLLFSYKPEQPVAMPTFDTLPLGLTTFGITKEEVKKYEDSVGGEETYNHEDEYEFVTPPGKYQADGRLYLFHQDKKSGIYQLEKTRQYFLDTDRGFWNYKGYFTPTNEFMELCEREGFHFEEYNILEHVYVFVSKEKGLTLGAQCKKFFGDPKPIIVLQINPGTKMIAHKTNRK